MDNLVLATPLLAIKGAICNSCFDSSNEMRKCGGCKRAYYCSSACQKKDWNSTHKKYCKIMAEIDGRTVAIPPTGRSWEIYRRERLSRSNEMQSKIPATSNMNSRAPMNFEIYCSNCYRNAFQLSSTEKFIVCQVCLLVHHCSHCPPKHPAEECGHFEQLRATEEFQVFDYVENGVLTPKAPTVVPRTTYKALSTASSWRDYFTKISDKAEVAGMITEDLMPTSEYAGPLAYHFQGATDQMTIPLTILAALETTLLALGDKKTLNLHIIGAGTREVDSMSMIEELLHLLPSLQTVHTTLIGPVMLDTNLTKQNMECCPACSNASRIRSFSCFHGLYHDYAASDMFEKPDLAVAFHTGHSQDKVEEWKPTIELLAKADFNTVFTCYNIQEIYEETKGFEKLGANFVKGGDINKWRGLRGYLEMAEVRENAFYYMNYMWYIIGPRR